MFYWILALKLDKGYYTYDINGGDNYSIELDQQHIIFTLDESPTELNITVQTQNRNATTLHFPELPFLQITNQVVTITNYGSKTQNLKFWIIPVSMCEGVDYSINVDYSLSWEFHFPKVTSNFCIFPNDQGRTSKTEVKIIESKAGGHVDFITNPFDTTSTPSCYKGDVQCAKTFSKPFFFRFHDVKGERLVAAVRHSASRFAVRTTSCGISALPFIASSTIQYPDYLSRIKNSVCRSNAERTLTIIGYTTVAILVGLIVIIILQLTKVINLLSLCQKPMEIYIPNSQPVDDIEEPLHSEEV